MVQNYITNCDTGDFPSLFFQAKMQIHNLDFHYHAGLERPAGTSLHDHLEHAVITGRRVLGVTDHLQFYWPRNDVAAGDGNPKAYANSLKGLAKYRREVEEEKKHFPSLQILFGPEIPPKTRLADIPQEVLDLADYFICEQAFRGDENALEENTETFIRRIEEIRDFTRATGKPTFLAHPFRLSINFRLIKRPIELWVTSLGYRHNEDFSPAELARFFLLDVEKVAAAASADGVPLEVNGSSEYRVRSSNLPAALQMLRAACRLFRNAGVELVPGSDQHGFTTNVGRMGAYVPYETFEGLGMKAEDIHFAQGAWKPF